jgi:ketosteroid isomerase-like protein
MSEENIELVRNAYDLWNRGDLDAFMGLIDEEVVIRAAEGWPEPVNFWDHQKVLEAAALSE